MRASHSVMLLNVIKNYFKYIFSNHIYILFLKDPKIYKILLELIHILGAGSPTLHAFLIQRSNFLLFLLKVRILNLIFHLLSQNLRFLQNWGFSGDSKGKESACNAGDLGSFIGSRRSLGEENDNPLRYSCLKNSMDRGAQWATIHGVAKSQTQLSE